MDAIIVVNKPQGITSFKVVEKIKKITKIKKVGHAGTLDPSAKGVLIICLGKACKKAKDFMNLDKEYVAEITFGITTDTGDSEGKILSSQKVILDKNMLDETLKSFVGEIEQIPPMVSAIHYKGERLYKLAKKGIVVERKPRKVNIKQIQLLSFDNKKDNPTAWIRVVCSKGTYIRTLCEDIGKKLGCGAYESQLIRTKIGNYSIEKSHTIEEIEDYCKKGKLSDILILPKQEYET